MEGMVPSELSCGDQVFCLDFHPIADYLATGIIDGSVEIWQYGYGAGGNRKVLQTKNHATACRGVKFDANGSLLYTISSDKSIRGLDGNGGEVFAIPQAHSAAINRMELLGDTAMVTGDDSGCVKLWDLRNMGPGTQATMEWHVHEDFISGLAFNIDANCLVSSSGDATFAVYDLRHQSRPFHSEQTPSELHCVQLLTSGSTVVFGTENGEVLVYRWDDWTAPIAMIQGHPEAVDCMWKVDESTVMTGSSDGLIRVVSVLPNRVLGVVGDHEEFPVEGMCASRDGRVLGIFAHDEVVRLWDLPAALDVMSGEEDFSSSAADGGSQQNHFMAGLL